MANEEHLELLRRGVAGWNAWRAKEPSVRPDLSRASLFRADLPEVNLAGVALVGTNLEGANLARANLAKSNLAGTHLIRANLSEADLSGAELLGAYLMGANLQEANLIRTHLIRANLSEANLHGAQLLGANLIGANLHGANLHGANLIQANLSWAALVETNLADAVLTGCRIYGISAWDVRLSEDTKQQDLIITPVGQPEVTTDDLEVAQFLYLMLHNNKLRRIIDTITSKVVLILGRFSAERKQVLDALRDELRKPERNYVPVVLDFEQPASRTTDETITLLARMARFVIADISDAKSVLQELRGIVPDCPTIPVQPIIAEGQEEPGMFDFFKKYPWFLEVHRYDSPARLLADLDKRVIGPLEVKAAELRPSGK
jgi:hypothetical protein